MKSNIRLSVMIVLAAMVTCSALAPTLGRCDSSVPVKFKLFKPGKFAHNHTKRAPVTSPMDPIPLPKNYHKTKKY